MNPNGRCDQCGALLPLHDDGCDYYEEFFEDEDDAIVAFNDSEIENMSDEQFDALVLIERQRRQRPDPATDQWFREQLTWDDWCWAVGFSNNVARWLSLRD